MSNLEKLYHSNLLDPFDVLFRNAFDSNSFFKPFTSSLKTDYPVDIYEDEKGLTIEIAAIGLDEEDIQIKSDQDLLSVSYQKGDFEELDEKKKYLCKSIANRSFSLSWKISNKLDLDKVQASLEKGLLKLEVPVKEEWKQEPKLISINSGPKKLNSRKQKQLAK